MCRTNFNVKFSLLFIIICHTYYAHTLTIDLEKNSICGLSKKQIQETLLCSQKYPNKGIAINSKCLKKQNIRNDRCLTEQYKLIECLRKECFLAQGKSTYLLYYFYLTTYNNTKVLNNE